MLLTIDWLGCFSSTCHHNKVKKLSQRLSYILLSRTNSAYEHIYAKLVSPWNVVKKPTQSRDKSMH